MRLRVYFGSYEKSGGEVRAMKFARLDDLPPGFVSGKTKGGKKRNLSEGKELVWDIDQRGFRVFDWSSARGDVTEIENFSVDSLD